MNKKSFLVVEMTSSGLVLSTSEARRLVMQGAVRVNDKPVEDFSCELLPGEHKISIIGKNARHVRVTVLD